MNNITVTISGPQGIGKTIISQVLVNALKDAGIPCLVDNQHAYVQLQRQAIDAVSANAVVAIREIQS